MLAQTRQTPAGRARSQALGGTNPTRVPCPARCARARSARQLHLSVEPYASWFARLRCRINVGDLEAELLLDELAHFGAADLRRLKAHVRKHVLHRLNELRSR